MKISQCFATSSTGDELHKAEVEVVRQTDVAINLNSPLIYSTRKEGSN